MTQIVFQGKTLVEQHHLVAPHHQLIGSAKKSLLAKGKNPSLHGNLVLHGDNLLALKALLPTHGGKVNCVYIDPPYNTGNEGWRYNDKVNSPLMKEWLGKMVDADDMSRHDKWLCMMWPRLTLLRELMAEDGVIFISIDDNEVHRLRMMMDEIFGDENFVACIVWQKKFSPQNDAKWLSDNHDFIVCYAKSKETWRPELLERTEESNARYQNLDNDPRGLWSSSGLDVKTYQKEYDYPIKTPSGRIVNPPNGRCWACNEASFKKMVKDNKIWFGKNGSNVPRVKRFLSEVKQGLTPTTVWLHSAVGHNQSATQELKCFGLSKFDGPKPVKLIKQILRIGGKEDALILDSFAGSGTTAQAVLELNKEDGGNRRFALVECEDYADKLTAERVRRVIRGASQAKNPALKAGLGGEFSYWELGGEIELKAILDSGDLPSYEELARYVFFTATGEQWNEKNMRKREFFAGESRLYEVYLYYKNSADFLASAAFDFEMAEKLPKKTGKQRLVFAPALHVNVAELAPLGIKFCQLPFEIYRLAANGKKAKKKK